MSWHEHDVAINAASGRPMANVRVQVLRSSDLSAANLYSDRAGTRIDNPVVTDADGNYDFYVVNGTYDLEFRVGSQLIKAVRSLELVSVYDELDALENQPNEDLSQIATFTTVAGQTQVPATGKLIDDLGIEFHESIRALAVYLSGAALRESRDYTYAGGSAPVVFTSPQPAGLDVIVIGQPQVATGGGAANLGADEVDVASYPGTTEAEDPDRFDHDGERFKNAQLDVTDPSSPNYRKAVRFFPGGGSGKLVLKDRDGNDVPQLTGVEAKFNAAVGDWLLDRWSQNGRFEPDSASAMLVDNKDDPGNWMPGVVIRAHGCRFRRAPRYHHRPYILCCDPVASPATTDPQTGIDTQSDVFVGNRIEGYPIVLGENHWRGYGQHANDVQVNAVTDFYAELIGLGSRSDVLYIGARSVGGGLYNAHNKRVEYHVIADGYNTNNRNVVSTIDVDGEIGRIWARRFSKFGGPAPNDNLDPNTGVGAPGVHDAEPNASFTTEPIYRNSDVEIYAEDCGSAGALFLPDNNSFPGFEAHNIRRKVTAVRSRHGGYIAQYGNKPTVPYNVELDLTVENSDVPYEILSGGARIKVFARDCPKAAFHGYFGFTSSDLHVTGDFLRCGSASGQVIENRGWDGGSIRNLRFPQSPNRIGIRNMPQDNPAQITRNLIIDGLDFDPGMVNAFYTDTTHDLRPGSIYESNVRLNGNTNFRWPVVGSTVRSIPTTGQYRQRDTMTVTGEPGSPRTIMALTTNAAGTVPTFAVQDYVQPFAAPVASGWDANFFTLTNILNAPNGVLTALAPMARAVAVGSQTNYAMQMRVPSGSTGIYFGMSYTQNPTSFSDIYFGAWLLDQTGGVGRVVGVAQGANAGTPVAIDYTDRVNVSMIAGNASVVRVLRANGTTVDVFTSGIPNTPFYPVILMGTPGERAIML